MMKTLLFWNAIITVLFFLWDFVCFFIIKPITYYRIGIVLFKKEITREKAYDLVEKKILKRHDNGYENLYFTDTFLRMIFIGDCKKKSEDEFIFKVRLPLVYLLLLFLFINTYFYVYVSEFISINDNYKHILFIPLIFMFLYLYKLFEIYSDLSVIFPKNH